MCGLLYLLPPGEVSQVPPNFEDPCPGESAFAAMVQPLMCSIFVHLLVQSQAVLLSCKQRALPWECWDALPAH